MILKCIDCGEKFDTEILDPNLEPTFKNKLIKIGNSYKCIKCRGYKFVIEEL